MDVVTPTMDRLKSFFPADTHSVLESVGEQTLCDASQQEGMLVMEDGNFHKVTIYIPGNDGDTGSSGAVYITNMTNEMFTATKIEQGREDACQLVLNANESTLREKSFQLMQLDAQLLMSIFNYEKSTVEVSLSLDRVTLTTEIKEKFYAFFGKDQRAIPQEITRFFEQEVKRKQDAVNKDATKKPKPWTFEDIGVPAIAVATLSLILFKVMRAWR